MRIENFRSEKHGNRKRIVATVSWEDSDRPPKEIYFETDEIFAEDWVCNPHAFLVGAIVPAMHHGEKRVLVDAGVCPELRDGLINVMGSLRHWYYTPDRELVQIESTGRDDFNIPYTPDRAGFFFSGGIDSLAALHINRLNYPLEHPGSFKDGLIIYGQNIESDNRLETFKQAVTALSEVTEDAGITLIPVHTNVRELDDNSHFFLYEFQGAVLAAVAHAFRQRLTSVSIASTADIINLLPFGSHPLLDTNYSSHDLQIRHTDVILSRLAKVRSIVDWDVALQNIKVCGPNWPGANCGQCEKCVRTMLELLVVGKLGQTSAFPNDVSEDLILSAVHITDHYKAACYRELIDPLTEKGHHDLVRAIEKKLDRFHNRHNKGGRKAKIRRFDNKYLNSSLSKLYHKLNPKRFA